jgi:hypothetical protein
MRECGNTGGSQMKYHLFCDEKETDFVVLWIETKMPGRTRQDNLKIKCN